MSGGAAALPAGRAEVALAAGYFAYFGAVGIFQPYWQQHLQALGYSASAIGALMAAVNAVRVVGPVAAGWAADHAPDRRPLLAAAALLAALTVPGLAGATSWWAALAGLAAYSLFFNGIVPVYDAHTLAVLGPRAQRYGLLRLWGSLGFVATSAAMGFAIARFGPGSIPWALFAAVVVTTLCFLRLPAAAARPHAPLGAGSFAEALRRPAVLAFLAVCFLQLASFGAYYSFYTLYLQRFGYSAVAIGFYWAWGVVAEIAVFVLGPALVARFGLRVLLYAALAGTAVRWALLAALPAEPVAMFVAQTLHLAGFGLFHTATVLLAPRLLPPGSEARAQALVGSVGWGAGGIAGSLIAGWTWDAVGPRAMYGVSLIIVMLALAVAATGLRDVAAGPKDG